MSDRSRFTLVTKEDVADRRAHDAFTMAIFRQMSQWGFFLQADDMGRGEGTVITRSRDFACIPQDGAKWTPEEALGALDAHFRNLVRVHPCVTEVVSVAISEHAAPPPRKRKRVWSCCPVL